MRSQVLFHRSHSLIWASGVPHPTYRPSVRFSRFSGVVKPPSRPSSYSRRLSSASHTPELSSGTVSEGPITDAPSGDPPLLPSVDPAEPPSDESEKPKTRRTRVSPTSKESEALHLPDGLHILWSPNSEPLDPSSSTALPPGEVLDEALNNLLITLHPQTQHRATYASPSGLPVEPTLALYCPIEGGEYVIDATVYELARRTDSEVVVLDAVHLAAGESGQFGKAANSLQLTWNPLHFPSSPPNLTSNNRPFTIEEEADESDAQSQIFTPSQVTLTLMAPSTMQGRALVASSSRRTAPPSKIKIFFDALINLPSQLPSPESSELSQGSPSSSRKPRLIYIRDFPTLAPSSASWYPPLLSAVRQRRRGPMSRPTSPILNPMTIIFGVTPPLVPPVSLPSSSDSNGGFMSFLTNRRSAPPHTSPSAKSNKVDWGEDEAAEKAREKRLKDRLRKWERGDAALRDELPILTAADPDADGNSGRKPEVVVIGGSSGMRIPSFLGSALSGLGTENSGRISNSEANARFFRTSILVPRVRSVVKEQASRVGRRREINQLTMRMAVSEIGGMLEKGLPPGPSAFNVSNRVPLEFDGVEEVAEIPATAPTDLHNMWEEWGKKVEVWSNVRQIADRAVGSVVAASFSSGTAEKSGLDPTDVPWSAVHRAWATHQSTRDLRKSWMKEASGVSETQSRDQDDNGELNVAEKNVDEVIERVKQDPELDEHEHRLLPCIVDAASMPTSFNQVHLPPHTIDSVRTIVSLPLLHPAAFQQGILKEHGMTGCLLFGPPGTGKTLVVRALAKEAGCRMMAISPSDVMDMYVGEGEKLVKAVFSLARKISPCVVFLDEIDALFGARTSSDESGGAFAHRGVITEFMQEMDGLKSSKDDNIIVIGATNRPFDLDDAVLRRLPRRLLVDLPGEKEREEILKIMLRDETLGSDVDVKVLAKKTESFSGSDLKHLCVSAALDAVKERVSVPWSSSVTANSTPELVIDVSRTSDNTKTQTTNSRTLADPDSAEEPVDPAMYSRVLFLRNFQKALKEITPSSSEALGSLAALRKWNEEFGEGRPDRKRERVWGKGRFGFIDQPEKVAEDGRVALIHTPSSNAVTGSRGNI